MILNRQSFVSKKHYADVIVFDFKYPTKLK